MTEKRGKLPPVLARGVARGWRTLSGMGPSDLIPQARLSGPMPWVIAIMIALMVIAAAAGFALRNMAASAAADLAGGITVQIVEADPAERDRQASAALAYLQGLPEVGDARAVSQSEVDALVEPWLGAELSDGDAIPVPALLDARLRGSSRPARIAQLDRELRRVAPAARVDSQSEWLRPVFGAIASLQWLAGALIALLALATAAAVLLAARTALGTNRDTVEIVHMLGGTDTQIARVFQRSIALDAAGGGAVGLGMGLGVILVLGAQFADLQAGMVRGGALDALDWVLLALIPVAGVLLAMITARISVMRALRRML